MTPLPVCPEIELDPVLVDLPLTSETTTLDLGALVPAGTYRELEFHTPLTVSASEPLALTLSVDVASWFRGPGGIVLDPSSAANALAIATNIRSSFAAFEDDDRNGLEDHRR